MKKSLLIVLLIACKLLIGQTSLPYSEKNICLDAVLPSSAVSVASAKNMVVKDFDLDGFNDILLCDSLTNNLFIYKNNSGTSFTPFTVVSFSPGLCPSTYNSIAAGDFDVDGKPDIAVCNNTSIKIYRNLSTVGSLAFSLTPYFQSYDLSSTYRLDPCYIKTGDLNKDNKDDIGIVTARTGAALGISFIALRNTSPGIGTFSFSIDQEIHSFTTTPILKTDTINCTIGDYDTDGDYDVVINVKKIVNQGLGLRNNSVAGGTIALAAGIQTVNFNIAGLTIQSSKITATKIADIDGDAKNDVVCLAQANSQGPILHGFAYFNAATNPAIANFQIPVINGGANQLVASEASLLTSTFAPIQDFELADINNDGKKDIIAICNKVLIIHMYLKNPPNNNIPFESTPTLLNLNPIYKSDEILAENFDNNGLIDFFIKPWRNLGIPGVIRNLSYSIKNIAIDSTVCSGKTASCSIAITPTNISFPNTFEWLKKGNPPTLITSSKTLTTSDPGQYHSVLNIPFPYGSPAICKIHSAFDTVRVKAIPNPSFSLSNTLSIVCPGQTATITATSIGTSTLGYIWSSQTGTISSSNQMVSSPSSSIDIYTVNAKDVLTSCTASETIYVNSYTLSQEQILFSKNPICLGDSVKLSYAGANSYTWSTASNSSFVYVKPNSATDYSLQITDSNGCTDSKFVRINIDKECDIKIYNSVTPNDDNVNDIWYIDNINRFPKNHVSIFNRWGQLVYETNGYDNVTNFWPPKNANNKIFSSTYFYVLDLNNGTAKIKGWIELIR